MKAESFRFRVDEETKAALDYLATMMERTKSDAVRLIIRKEAAKAQGREALEGAERDDERRVTA
jgi:predicted transcriptional regulator